MGLGISDSCAMPVMILETILITQRDLCTKCYRHDQVE